MDDSTLTKYLKSQKKLHLKGCFTNLLQSQNFEQDLFKIDLETLEDQLNLFEPATSPFQNISPYTKAIEAGSKDLFQNGIEVLKKGLGGCLLIAGGQGSRLGHNGPKGTFKITLIKQKSLFQIFAERVKAASEFVQRDLPLAIMTSPLNEAATRLFFEENQFFGLKQNQIFIFSQSMLPFLDFNKCLIPQEPDFIARGPDGNGSCFETFFKSGIGNQWIKSGIQYLNVILIDNSLADPYDFEVFGTLVEKQNDVVIKSCLRKYPNEQVGIIVESNQKPIVIEYHEIPDSLFFDKEPPANLSMLALKMSFVKQMATQKLPLHKVKKKCLYWDFTQNQIQEPSSPNAWKFEKYLFDILPYSKSTSVLLYPRSEIFSPLKNLSGDNSIESVQRDLLNKELKIYEAISNCKTTLIPFELSAQFYYPTPELKERWLNQKALSPYLF